MNSLSKRLIFTSGSGQRTLLPSSGVPRGSGEVPGVVFGLPEDVFHAGVIFEQLLERAPILFEVDVPLLLHCRFLPAPILLVAFWHTRRFHFGSTPNH